MNLTQYRRMCVFAMRMVKVIPKHHQRACREHVAEVLSHINCVNFSLHYSQIIDWDNSEDYTDEEIAEQPYRRYSSKNRTMCDWVSKEYGEDNSTLTRQTLSKDGDYDTKLRSHLMCCIRAALDVAASPSGGVVGYTVGDLREMWAPRPIPSWVLNFFKEPTLVASAPDEANVWL
jgi:hypothetical protein